MGDPWVRKCMAFRAKYNRMPDANGNPVFRFLVTQPDGNTHRYESRSDVLAAIPGLADWQLTRLVNGHRVHGHDGRVARITETWFGDSLPGSCVSSMAFYRRAVRRLVSMKNGRVNVEQLRGIAAETWKYYDTMRAEPEPARYFASTDDPVA